MILIAPEFKARIIEKLQNVTNLLNNFSTHNAENKYTNFIDNIFEKYPILNNLNSKSEQFTLINEEELVQIFTDLSFEFQNLCKESEFKKEINAVNKDGFGLIHYITCLSKLSISSF